jgi:hypothetical protein
VSDLHYLSTPPQRFHPAVVLSYSPALFVSEISLPCPVDGDFTHDA